MTTTIDGLELDLLLDLRFETEHGPVRTRDATTGEIRTALERITTALGRLIARSARTTDQDRLDHLGARVTALAEQADDLRVALAWVRAKQEHAESRWADYLPGRWAAA